MQVIFNWGCFIIGIIVGVMAIVIPPWRTDGILRIDHSDPDKDIYRFDISDLNALNKKHRIILKIDNHADLSQK